MLLTPLSDHATMVKLLQALDKRYLEHHNSVVAKHSTPTHQSSLKGVLDGVAQGYMVFPLSLKCFTDFDAIHQSWYLPICPITLLIIERDCLWL